MPRLLLLLSFSLLLSCSKGPSSGPVEPAAPEDMHGQDCAVCGMIVNERPAPRAQVLHRDGTRAFTCSIADLRAYLDAPNPHGPATDVWVEDLGPGWTPENTSTAARPWIRAEDALYVVGLKRPLVMGAPEATFSSVEDARRLAASAPGLSVRGWKVE